MPCHTDNRLVMAIFQILYGQYHICDLYVLGLKSKVFCKNNNQILKTMDKGLRVLRWIP